MKQNIFKKPLSENKQILLGILAMVVVFSILSSLVPSAKLKQVSNGHERELSHAFAHFGEFSEGDTLVVIEWDQLNVNGGSDHYADVTKKEIGVVISDTSYERNLLCDYERYVAVLVDKPGKNGAGVYGIFP